MEQNSANIQGMLVTEAKEHILNFITTKKLNEKRLLTLKREQEKWENRVRLAQNSGADDLIAQAAAACQSIEGQIHSLEAENGELKTQIQSMIGQLPGLAARERSIDPDILEQELLLAAGFTPGEPSTDQKFTALEQREAAESALQALKQKVQPASPDDEV
jgi:phage shock protein A